MNKDLKNILPIILKLCIIIFILVATLQAPVDLDLGWHLRYGQYFFQTGHVLKDNILSFVWPDYKWIQASWGYDLLVYQIFTRFGFFGISLAGSIFSLIIFLLVTMPLKKLTPFQLFLLAVIFITQSAPLYGTGMRSQTPSTLFFAISLIVTFTTLQNLKFNRQLFKNSFFYLPLIFLIWANMHGGFSLGLIFISLLWLFHGIINVIQERRLNGKKLLNWKVWWCLGLMIFFSYLTPLLNPWGMRIYEETLRHSTNLNLNIITEWMPIPIRSVEGALILIILFFCIFIGILRKRKDDIAYLIILLLSTYMAFNALRFIIIFAVIATYYVAQTLPTLTYSELPRIFRNTWLFILSKAAVFGFVLFNLFFVPMYFSLPPPYIFHFSWNDYCRPIQNDNSFSADCSEGVTNAMLKDIPKGNGFHPYNYGGYLSWRVPQVKTFLDGRMAAWEENGKTPPIIQGDWIFLQKDPLAFRAFDSQYHFRWMIVPTSSPITRYLDNLTKNGKWDLKYKDVFYSYYVKK